MFLHCLHAMGGKGYNAVVSIACLHVIRNKYWRIVRHGLGGGGNMDGLHPKGVPVLFSSGFKKKVGIS